MPVACVVQIKRHTEDGSYFVNELWYISSKTKFIGNQMFDRFGNVGEVVAQYTEDDQGKLIKF